MEENQPVSDKWHKLEANEEPCREDASKVHHNPYSVDELIIIEEALSWSGMIYTIRFVAEDSIIIQKHEACERKTHQGTSENRPQDEIIQLSEPDRLVYLTHSSGESIRRRVN